MLTDLIYATTFCIKSKMLYLLEVFESCAESYEQSRWTDEADPTLGHTGKVLV